MIKDNKYANYYFRIIEKARSLPKPTIAEEHHIIPKCIGGPNTKENLVYLSTKQHFVVHLLLTKMAENSVELRKFGRAFKMMCTSSSDTPGRPSAKTYQIERTKFIIRMGSMSSEELAKRSATMKKKYKENPEWALARAKSIKVTMATDEYRNKIKIERSSRSSNQEYLDKLSKKSREFYDKGDNRLVHGLKIKDVRSTNESREKTTKNLLAQWATPEGRALRTAANRKGAETRKRNNTLKDDPNESAKRGWETRRKNEKANGN